MGVQQREFFSKKSAAITATLPIRKFSMYCLRKKEGSLDMRRILGGSLIAMVLVLAGCAASAPPAIGVWNIEMNTPLGAMPAVLTISGDGTGVMSGDLGEQNISGIMFDGNAINFTADLEAQGQSISLTFSGTVDGDSLSGEFGSDFGAFGVTGTRQ